VKIKTARTLVRPWRDSDRGACAAMLADPEVMHDYPAPLSRGESDDKIDRYAETYRRLGYGRMAFEKADGEFIGLIGIMPIHEAHSALGAGVEIGWRMVRSAWGKGYATEAARAVLDAGFARLRFPEVISFTSPSNLRSQAVMERLGLQREPARDYSYEVDGIAYTNVVFVAYPPVR
jgi:RimJ/RimL family protein N-acetyltransferase